MKSIQKCRNLIRCGKSSNEAGMSKVAQLVSEASAFIIVKGFFNLFNAMKRNTKSPTTIDKVTTAEVDYVMRRLKAKRYSLR
jgi:hypothetical protein